MNVPKGTRIMALDEKRTLISEGDWHPDASRVVDFSAKYTIPSGIDGKTGETVFGNRGFAYKDKGIVWDFE